MPGANRRRADSSRGKNTPPRTFEDARIAFANAEHDAYDARTRAEDDARLEYGDTVLSLSIGDIGYTTARRQAETTLRTATERARRTFERAKAALHRQRGLSQHAAQRTENRELASAYRARVKTIADADKNFDRKKRELNAALAAALSGLPGGAEVGSRFAAKKREFREEFKRREEKIFDEPGGSL